MENMSQEQINGLHALIAIVVFIIGICCLFAYKTIVRARQAKELAKNNHLPQSTLRSSTTVQLQLLKKKAE